MARSPVRPGRVDLEVGVALPSAEDCAVFAAAIAALAVACASAIVPSRTTVQVSGLSLEQ